MLAYGGAGDVECRRYFSRGQFVVRHQPQDRATARLGERAQGLVRRGLGGVTARVLAAGATRVLGPPVVGGGQAHRPTWLPSGSVKIANRP